MLKDPFLNNVTMIRHCESGQGRDEAISEKSESDQIASSLRSSQ